MLFLEFYWRPCEPAARAPRSLWVRFGRFGGRQEREIEFKEETLTRLLGLLSAKTEQCHELPVFWGALGAVLEPPWGRLGPSWAVLGASRSPSRSQISKKINVEIEPLFDTPWEGYIFR